MYLGRSYLYKNASIAAFWAGLGVASGAILDAVIVAVFGLGRETDALFASMAIPFLVGSTLDVQTPKILIPALTHCLTQEGEEATCEFVRNLISTAVLILLCFSILVSACAGVMMPL